MYKYVLFFVLLMATPAYASNGFTCDNDQEWNEFANECVDHPKLKQEAGVGADVLLWKNEDEKKLMQEFFAEYRYDANNDNNKIYGVVQLNLWDKIKALFNKEEK